MKRILAISLGFLSGIVAFAETIPLYSNTNYFNAGLVNNALQIDATAFVNLGTFELNTTLPFDTSNTRYFTNRGSMFGSVGYRFDRTTTTTPSAFRYPANNFFNTGTISADDFGGAIIGGGATFLGAQGSYVFVSATNILSSGTLEVGNVGLLRLNGKNVDLSRGALVAGESDDTGSSFGGFGTQGTNIIYFNPGNVTDLYWGVGVQTNNLGTFTDNLIPPDEVSSPQHRVFTAGGSTNGFLTSLPATFDAEFEAFANVTDAGNETIVQVAFVNTNFGGDSVTVNVGFVPFDTGNPAIENPDIPAIIVDFSTDSSDPISGGTNSTSISFIDSTAQQTNIVLFNNYNNLFGGPARTKRPSSYEITSGFGFAELFPGNADYDPAMLYDPAIAVSNRVAGYYAGYSAQIGSSSTNSSGGLVIDPTNVPPRIEINANNLNLNQTRMRSEGPILINATNLTGVPKGVSAGLFEVDLGNTNGTLVITNIFPASFQRLRGDLYAYTYIWHNVESFEDPDTGDTITNSVTYHVLILDQSLRSDIVPQTPVFRVHSTNVVIRDDLTLTREVRLDAQNMTIASKVTLADDAVDLTAPNLIGIRNFLVETNGILQGGNNVYLGFPDNGFKSITNRGTISAVAPLFKSDSFVNSGFIEGVNGGNIVIQANSAVISNDVAPASLRADNFVYISSSSLFVTNSLINAGITSITETNFQFDPETGEVIVDPDTGEPIEVVETFDQYFSGKLVLDVSGSLSDGNQIIDGLPIHNFWRVTDGFSLAETPFSGDLYGTEIESIAPDFSFAEISHVWAGKDLGTNGSGFLTNAVLGRLHLNLQSPFALMRFSGNKPNQALYVNDLVIDNPLSLDLLSAISIDSDFKIYYRTANVDLSAFAGQFVQYTGTVPTSADSILDLKVNGLGTVSPNLDGKNLKIGSSYVIKARPGPGQIFDGWSGSAVSADTRLGFAMKPNTVLRANFRPNPLDPVKGAYNGLFSDLTNGVSLETSGFFNFNVTKSGQVTGKIISGKAYRFKGHFNASGYAEMSVGRGNGKTPLALTLQLDLQNGSDEVVGTVSGEGWSAALRGDLAQAKPEYISPRYTVAISGSTNAAIAPAGNGFGTVQSDAAGRVQIKGALADGTKFSQRIPVSKNGQVPFYLPLYKGSGSLLSWLQLTNNSLSGDAIWIKKAAAKGLYQGGFTNISTITGSSYSPTSASVLDILDGTVTLSGGDLNVALSNVVSLANNTVTVTGDNQLSLSFKLPTGLLTGSFVHPETHKKTLVQGVVLQQQKEARGFFLGTTQGGSVLLEGN